MRGRLLWSKHAPNASCQLATGLLGPGIPALEDWVQKQKQGLQTQLYTVASEINAARGAKETMM